jgi:hypothetical protein
MVPRQFLTPAAPGGEPAKLVIDWNAFSIDDGHIDMLATLRSVPREASVRVVGGPFTYHNADRTARGRVRVDAADLATPFESVTWDAGPGGTVTILNDSQVDVRIKTQAANMPVRPKVTIIDAEGVSMTGEGVFVPSSVAQPSPPGGDDLVTT